MQSPLEIVWHGHRLSRVLLLQGMPYWANIEVVTQKHDAQSPD